MGRILNLLNHIVTQRIIVKKNIIFLLVCILFVSSCENGPNSDQESENKYLLTSTYLKSMPAAAIQVIIGGFANGIVLNDKNDVDIYKIEYNTTDIAGDAIIASGAIIVPQGSNEYPILSYQHGSLHKQSDAPSEYDTGVEVTRLATGFAGGGYVVVVPDYLGYGSSSDYPHPYEHAKTLASTSFDMLQAAYEFIDENDIQISEKLFLTGYSEGGFATMALHKYIEDNSDIVVTMSAPASGAYNKTAFSLNVLQQDKNLSFLSNYMWVVDTYNWIYDINRRWDQIVNSTDAQTLNSVTNPKTFHEADISSNPSDLFLPNFINGIVAGSDTEFIGALADNDIYDWYPKYPITLYYGTLDDFVFPLNSTTAYDAIKANGGNITKKGFPLLNHSTLVPFYLYDVFNLFESLK